MKPSLCSFSFLFLLLLFSFLPFHAITARNLILETCKKCSQNDPNLSYNFCVASLEAVPRSHCANLQQLGVISMNLTLQNVTDTKSFIKEYLKKKKLNPFVKACLNDCFELHSDAIPTIKQAMKDYKAKHYEDANIGMSSVLDACTTCEDGFKEKEDVVSPLTKRNNDTFQLSVIALSIVNMMNLH